MLIARSSHGVNGGGLGRLFIILAGCHGDCGIIGGVVRRILSACCRRSRVVANLHNGLGGAVDVGGIGVQAHGELRARLGGLFERDLNGLLGCARGKGDDAVVDRLVGGLGRGGTRRGAHHGTGVVVLAARAHHGELGILGTRLDGDYGVLHGEGDALSFLIVLDGDRVLHLPAQYTHAGGAEHQLERLVAFGTIVVFHGDAHGFNVLARLKRERTRRPRQLARNAVRRLDGSNRGNALLVLAAPVGTLGVLAGLDGVRIAHGADAVFTLSGVGIHVGRGLGSLRRLIGAGSGERNLLLL